MIAVKPEHTHAHRYARFLRILLCAVLAACTLFGACTVAAPPEQDRPQADEAAGDAVPPTDDSGIIPGSQGPPGPSSQWSTISAEKAKEIMSEEDHILLDVRTEEEFAEAHIEGAILIPHDEIAIRAETELSDKEAVILVYCRSGRRSAAAAETLAGLGYARVFDFGGIIDWPYETVTGDC